MLRGNAVILRPVRREDLETLENWEHDPYVVGEFNSFGLRGHGGWERIFAENGLLSDQLGRLVVTTLDGVLIGRVSFHPVRNGPGEGSKAYMIGIGLHPDHQGKGYGVEAQRLLTDYLFATYSIMRVQTITDITNRPEQRALEKAGFTREGVIRKAQWRNGDWHDQVLFSRLRGE
ncbi:GNAT family N-acetyltransferase [Ktedonospora formicarum]|uniref:Alanine acetyltransferase n=1 Tax=Ktedonospora formicarum TaxID=2778364 RepID=A0A8J3I2R2_9CHLR|nr:GNAT family protein [Ktedonospora formicarum]GHO43824.1 alanine acetyltransferase [Ktedonospora formicarum]